MQWIRERVGARHRAAGAALVPVRALERRLSREEVERAPEARSGSSIAEAAERFGARAPVEERVACWQGTEPDWSERWDDLVDDEETPVAVTPGWVWVG